MRGCIGWTQKVRGGSSEDTLPPATPPHSMWRAKCNDSTSGLQMQDAGLWEEQDGEDQSLGGGGVAIKQGCFRAGYTTPQRMGTLRQGGHMK